MQTGCYTCEDVGQAEKENLSSATGTWGNCKETALTREEQSLFKLTVTQAVKIFHALN
jgi:hypothetical protein